MEFSIQPYEGVGSIRFGMTRDEVRHCIGLPATPFMKTSFSEYPTDAFSDLHMHVHYKTSDVCEAVEFGGNTVPTFQGKPLLHVPFRDLLKWLKSLDQDIEVDDTGLTSKKFGFGIYMSSVDEENLDDPSEGVIVFDEGYYG